MKKETVGRDALGAFAPKHSELYYDVHLERSGQDKSMGSFCFSG